MSYSVKYICKALLGISLFLTFVTACSDVVEKDVSDEYVKLVAPGNGVKLNESSVFFYWDDHEDARNYRIQVATPNFQAVQRLVLDSLTSQNQYQLNLSPGNYQWRVRIENNEELSPYVSRSFEVDSNDNISNVKPVLRLPLSNHYSKEDNFQFTWEPVFGATLYKFRIRENDFESGNPYTSDKDVTVTTTTSNVALIEGVYYWGVRAQNDKFNSQFNSRKLTIDKTAPAIPTLIAPTTNSTVQDITIEFKWSVGAAGLAPETDSIQIFTDQALTQLRKVALITTNQLYSDSLGVGIYYWRVKRQDAAGNTSNYTTANKLTIQ